MRHSTGAAWSHGAGMALLLATLVAAPAVAQERRPSLDHHEARRAALERQRRGTLAPGPDAPDGGTAAADAWAAAVYGRYGMPYGGFDLPYRAFGLPYDGAFAVPYGDFDRSFSTYDRPYSGFGAPPAWPGGGWHPGAAYGSPGARVVCRGVVGPAGRGGYGPWTPTAREMSLQGTCRSVGYRERFPYGGGPGWFDRDAPYFEGAPGPWGRWHEWRGWPPGWRRRGPRMPYDWPWGWPFVPRHRFDGRYGEDGGVAVDGYRAGGAVPGGARRRPSTALPPDPYRGGGAAPGAYAGVGSGAPVDAADCAAVSVHIVNGGVFRGWVSRVRFGARDPRELELAIDAQLSGGRPVDLLTADGYLVRVPPTAPVERIVVGACATPR